MESSTTKASAVREKIGMLYDPDVAELLRITVPTLKARRSRGTAPPSSKIGRDHVTFVDDLKRWIATRRAGRRAAA
jgi:hypothetical protein